MKLTRREVTRLGLASLAGVSALFSVSNVISQARQPLSMLVLGGTGFLGPHLVRYAIARGHTLTLFNRGRTGPDEFPDVETLIGDRAGDLDVLKGRKWDVVVDTSTFFPALAARSASLLGPNVGQYIYISSIAVYKDWTNPVMNDDSPVLSLDQPDQATFSAFQRYGAAKADSEREVEKACPDKYTVIRPDAITGPGDKGTYVYTYWVRRAAQAGPILAPGSPGDFIQYVDVRDLGEWIVHCAENSILGTYTATSPGSSYTMKNMLDDCQLATKSSAQQVWVDTEFLNAQGVEAIPMWFPKRASELGVGRFDTSKAQRNGLKTRPKIETARDVHEWLGSLPEDKQDFVAGLSASEESVLLTAWAQAKSNAGRAT